MSRTLRKYKGVKYAPTSYEQKHPLKVHPVDTKHKERQEAKQLCKNYLNKENEIDKDEA